MDFKIEGLTDEQNKAIQAEIERRVTSAVQTNTKKVTEEVTKAVAQSYEGKITEAVAAATQSATMTEAQKIESLNAELERMKKQIATEQLKGRVEKRLLAAGYDEKTVETIAPFMANAADEVTLDATLNAFITAQQNAVNSALEKQKQDLALNVTPPAGTGSPNMLKQDVNTTMQQIMNNPNAPDPMYASAQAIQFLLDNQGAE